MKKVSEDDRLFAYRMSREMYKMQEAILMREVKEVREEKQKAKELGYAEGHAEGHAEGLAEGIAEGRAEGIAEGRAEGSAESAKRIARNLKMENFSPQKIAELTGLRPEEIEKL